MKLLPLAIASLGLIAAIWPTQTAPQILILTGDANGNLAPCGCTKPMTGGIKRRIQAAKELSVPGHTTLLDNGNMVAGVGRQDQIKAQTMAEMLAAAGWDAINLGPADANLGLGTILSVNSLANNKMLASEVQPSPGVDLKQYSISGPFLVIGITAHPDQVSTPLGLPPVSIDDAVNTGLQQAQEGNLAPILLLQGNLDEAKDIAARFPAIKLIEYGSTGSPQEQMQTVGNTVLVTPGSDGKYLLKLEYANGKFTNYAAIALGPRFKDDPTAARLYRAYLARIDSEHLLEKLPRMQTASYTGSKSCGSCHAKAETTWKHSLHNHALLTLAQRGHDRDPDCLPCHVVGLASIRGFTSLKQTPDLAGVGCENCHGPGLAHAKNPKLVRLPKVTANTCATCHTSNTSPNFSFPLFWKKIKH